ncbi:MAG: hypothetical protein Q9205_005890, partial [Flavoplaca limonia]
MDPISATASLIQLIDLGRQTLHALGALASPAAVQKDGLMLEVHLGMLDEISQLTLDSNMELPRDCPVLCKALQRAIEDVRIIAPRVNSPLQQRFTMDAAVQQMRDQQQTQDLIDRQIVAHQHLHEDYTAQVTQLKQFAVQGFAQNNERIHAGLDNLLSSMQFSEAKIN